jgi:hypothetical protein
MIQTAARSDRPDMRAGVHAAVADTGAGAHHRTGMAAGRNAVPAHASARADTADMSASTHAVAAHMCPDTHAQDLDIRAYCKGRNGCEKRQRGDGGGEHFHGRILLWLKREQAGAAKVPPICLPALPHARITAPAGENRGQK